MEKEKVEKILRESLLKLAAGYDYDEITREGNGVNKKLKVVKKHVPPSLAAIAPSWRCQCSRRAK